MHPSVSFVARRASAPTAILVLAFAAVAAGLPARPAGAAPRSISPSLYQPTLMRLGSLNVPAQPVALIYVEAAPAPVPALTLAARPAPTRSRVAVAQRPVRGTAASGWAVGPVRGAGNGFAYGQCTWYVAHKRNVPWRGNAWQWWWNARPFGFREGWQPRVGAIAVMGYSSSSPWGHVAYVERVYGDGSFLVSEMNWWGVPGGGWGRVDYRLIRSMRGILGFIY